MFQEIKDDDENISNSVLKGGKQLEFFQEGDDLTLFTLKLKDFEEIKPCLRDIDSDGDSDVSDLDDSDSDTDSIKLPRFDNLPKGDAQVDDTSVPLVPPQASNNSAPNGTSIIQ